MKISYNWLKEYVDIKVSAEKLAGILTMAGLSVESVSKLGDDSILDIEITANRPDWLSVIGVAREVAALTAGKLKLPAVTAPKVKGREAGIKVSIEDKKLCPRYTARVIRNVKVADSPAWLKGRIEAMGLRPVNNIVDITNFCLFETGEPMHAFDLDKLSGGCIVVRKAVKGEKIFTIEGTEKTLEDTALIIADNAKPVAIAGVMGALNTEVNYSTKNILLEAAYFDPISIRRTSRKIGISSESSYRFERRVDPENIAHASNRALGFILELAGGEAGEFVDVKGAADKPKAVALKHGRLNNVLGADIGAREIKKIVTALGMKVKASSKDGLKLESPGFRHDLKGEIDVIEEVARVYGYNNIPSTLPNIVDQPIRMEADMVARNRMLECLTGLGVDEIITYSLLSKKLIAAAGFPANEAIDIKNPLTSEQEAMRPSLISGMLGAMLWNINRKARDLKLFELGNVYMKKEGGVFGEKKHLCIGIAGQAFESWIGPARASDFYELKGMAETLFAELGIQNVSFKHATQPGFSSSECAEILIGSRSVGFLGEINRRVLGDFDIKEKVYILEADADAILDNVAREKVFSELPKYPAVYRDISIIAGKGTQNADVITVIRAAAGPMLKDAKLIDRYRGKQIPEDKVSLTYRLEYQLLARTLEDKDVLEAGAKVLRELDEKLGAKLR
jgi:phenylalanyl-tRNA synthetase beta chain